MYQVPVIYWHCLPVIVPSLLHYIGNSLEEETRILNAFKWSTHMAHACQTTDQRDCGSFHASMMLYTLLYSSTMPFFCSHCFHLSGKRSLAWPALESSLYSLLISWASYMYYLLSNSPWRALMAILCGICNISCSSLAKHWRALCRCCSQCNSKYNSELSVHISITSTLGIWHVLPSCYPHSIHVRSLWNISELRLK